MRGSSPPKVRSKSTEHVRVSAKSRLLRRREAVTADTISAIDQALIVALELPHN